MKLTSLIRAAKREDLAEMKAVIEAAGLFPSDMLDDMTAPFFNNTNTTDMWFVVVDKVISALAYCAPERMTQGTWNVYLIAVNPAQQGCGIGTGLMKHIEKCLADRGERLLIVETSGSPEFEKTRQFYLNNHYTLEARIREFYTAGEDKMVFYKAL